MSPKSPLLLIGVGGAGSSIAYGVSRAFGAQMRYVLCDTDAAGAREASPFILLGGDRLSGHGSGGDAPQAKLAAEESLHLFGEHLDGVRLAVIVTALGGGTGSGSTIEILKHLRECGIPTIVFAATPFGFEGEERIRRADAAIPAIEEFSGAAIFTPLDKLVGGEENMDAAMRRALDTIASGVTLFWRLILKPGYIRIDTENIRRIIATAARGHFATASAQGDGRIDSLVSSLKKSIAARQGSKIKSILLGVLAGEDLRLSEVGALADAVRSEYGRDAAFNLATVNDEETFSGRIAAVLMLFETRGGEDAVSTSSTKRRKRDANPLQQGPRGRGRFSNTAPTYINHEDVDVPTYIRKGLQLEI